METQNINISNIIIETINNIFNQFFSSFDNTIYSVLDDIIFINTDIIDNTFLKVLGTSPSDGLLLISNSLVLGFILYYCFRLLFSHLLGIQVQKPYQFIFKLIVYAILMNYSYFICENIIYLNSAVSSSIRFLGELLFKKNICFSQLITHLDSIVALESKTLNIFSIDGLLKTVLSISLFNLVISYSFRYILIKLFVMLTPFAILSLCTPSTSFFFKSWFRAFISVLFIQHFVALILLIIFSVKLDNTILTKLIYIGSFYVLLKANNISKELLGGITTEINTNIKGLNSFRSIGKI